jgi:hypothetical protein
MTKTEKELAGRAQLMGLTLIHNPGGFYRLQDWQGTVYGPFSANMCRVWLTAYHVGQHAHAVDCECGRVACNLRNATLHSVAS